MAYSYDDLENESLYLDADKDSIIVKEILARQSHYEYQMNNTKFYYDDAISDYNQFIKIIAEFIRELKLEDNSIILSILLRRLLFNGYFSKNNFFKADSKQLFHDVDLFLGMDIIDGRGCCRHLANFYNAIFKEIGYYSQIFPCYYGGMNCTLSEASVNNANHAANLIMIRIFH